MRRLSQGVSQELREFAIYSPNGEVPFETAMYECGQRILCVAAPQSMAERVFREVADVPYERLEAAFNFDEIIHDALGIPDEAIVWMIDLPDRRGVPKAFAALKQAQQFLTREAAWGEPEPPAPQTPPEPLDDAGNPEPPDLGEVDLGEHDAPDEAGRA